MMPCQFYRASTPSHENQQKDQIQSNTQSSKPRCLHRCANHDTRNHVACCGDFTRCNMHLDLRQLNEFIQSEMSSRRVEVTYNNNDSGGVLKIENGTWAAMELTRRFGRRQSRKEETVLEFKDHGFTFSHDMPPASFNNTVIFPLDTI